jgi:hypothetical protein
VASEEDARAAARRIVEEVLASREEAADAAPVTATADPPTPAARASADPKAPASAATNNGQRAADLVDGAVEEFVEHADEPVPAPQVSEARQRARALVAEVLAAHEAAAEAGRSDADLADPTPAGRQQAVTRVTTDAAAAEDAAPEPVVDDAVPDDPASEDVTPESTSRLRARELVAAAIAEAEARETAAAAEAEQARRAEAEAAAAREREQEAARQLAEALAQEEAERAEREAREREQRALDARALAEEPERELWAAADRDAASETLQMDRQDDAPVPDADDTTPLSVAELAAASQAARSDDQPAGEGSPDATAAMAVPDDPASATALIPVTGGPTSSDGDRDDAGTGAVSPVRDRTEAIAVVEPQRTGSPPAPADEGRTGSSAVVVESGVPVLEATVGLDDVGEGRRPGRWLLASILGAITLAILFPLAINALLRLVSLS